MNRRPCHFAALLLCLSIGYAAVARGQDVQDDILKAIPEQAIGFLLVNRLQDTSDKIDEIARSVQSPTEPGLLAKLRGVLTFAKGLDAARSAAVIAMATDQIDKPAPVVLVPVTDYKEFISQLSPKDSAAEMTEVTVAGQVQLVARKGRYAALAPSENKAALELVLKSKRDVSATLPKPLVGWLTKNEASVVVTPGGIKLISAAGLAKLALVKLQQQAGGGQPGPAGPQVPLDPAIAGFGEDLLKSLPSEVSHAGVGLWVDSSNALHLTTRLMFVGDGSLAAEAKKVEAPKEDLFAHVPVEPYVFAWKSSARTSLSRKFTELFAEVMRSNPAFAKINETQVKQLRDALADAGKGVRSMSGMVGIAVGKENFFSRSVSISQVDDAKVYLASQEKLVKLMSDIVKDAKPSLLSYETKMGKLDDRPMLVMTTAATPAAKGPGQAMTPAMQILGPSGKLSTYVVAVDNNTVLTAYESEEIARKAVARYLKGGPGLNSDPEVAKTAALLPQGAQVVAYFSPHGFMAMVKSMMTNMGMPFAGMVPDIPETPPIGIAARIVPAGLATDLIVPSEVFETIGGVVAAMQPPAGN